jgi:hypothetical protein
MREKQSLIAKIPRRLTARWPGWASRKEARRIVDEGMSLRGLSSRKKKKGKDSEVHAVG